MCDGGLNDQWGFDVRRTRVCLQRVPFDKLSCNILHLPLPNWRHLFASCARRMTSCTWVGRETAVGEVDGELARACVCVRRLVDRQVRRQALRHIPQAVSAALASKSEATAPFSSVRARGIVSLIKLRELLLIVCWRVVDEARPRPAFKHSCLEQRERVRGMECRRGYMCATRLCMQ